MTPDVQAVDAFDLPDWLGTCEVTWRALSSVRGARRIRGELGNQTDPTTDAVPCDLLAADVAAPEPLLPESWRRQAHQVWEYGQVLLVSYDGRLTLAVPGTAYSADGTLETISRLARALGVAPSRFTVCLRL